MAVSEGKERRQFERYATDDSLFATFRPHFDRIGKVKDISKGGMSIEYTVYEEFGKTESVEVDLFSHKADFHLSRLSCKVVYDTGSSDYQGFSGFEVRRCGLEFSNLSPRQRAMVESAFGHFTIGPTPY